MTPLAAKIAKQLTIPKDRRSLVDTNDILPRITDFHCFDVSAVRPLIKHLAQNILDTGNADARTSFLPAKHTWIEWGRDRHDRRAFALIDEDFAWAGEPIIPGAIPFCLATGRSQEFQNRMAQYDETYKNEPLLQCTGIGPLYLGTAAQWDIASREETLGMHYEALASLALINTPRLIGRKQHMANRGLERKLARSMGAEGRFPLRGWTEIELSVTPNSPDGKIEETRYTGARCLHFCRAHLRVRLGRVEMVSAHWRGDASLGIKRSRYTLIN